MARHDAPGGKVLDLEGALARLGGDRKLFAELVGYFLEDAPKLFDEVSAAMTSDDAAAVRRKAHALKGLVASCGAERATAVAQLVEDAGDSGNLSMAPILVKSLECELATLSQALSEHVARDT
jgi:HPt (histidine-containing phosphotransfer) domain-containing protein